jgi:hypothetical protein
LSLPATTPPSACHAAAATGTKNAIQEPPSYKIPMLTNPA